MLQLCMCMCILKEKGNLPTTNYIILGGAK